MIVPQAVRRMGSQLDVPVMIVSVAPVSRLIRCTPGSAVPCSLHVMRCVGFESFGQKAIMSVFAPEDVVTTRALRPLASVMSFVGSALAVAASMDCVDEAATGLPTPNRSSEALASLLSRSEPKSLAANAAPANQSPTAATAMIASSRFFPSRLRTMVDSPPQRHRSSSGPQFGVRAHGGAGVTARVPGPVDHLNNA